MNILITGVKGMLGNAVKEYFLAQNCNVYGVYRSGERIDGITSIQIDLTNPEEFKTLEQYKTKIDVVVHCAANVNVNACEEDKEATDKIHVKSSEQLAKLLSNSKFIYISTDSIYDGVKGNFNEEDTPNPKNYYAKSKLAGEQKVIENNINSYLLRTNIYGFKQPFGSSLFEWAYTNLEKHNSISGYSNVYFNPLYVNQLAEVIYLIVKNNIPAGIYNIGGVDSISKYNFISLINDIFQFNATISSSELPGMINGVERPLNTTMNIEKIAQYIDMTKYTIRNGIANIKTKIAK
jgi:dTDP-4-dehydrorhamnose reductase